MTKSKFKIDSRTYQAYKKAKIEGISVNDSYNVAVLGIDKKSFNIIDKAVWSHSGFRKQHPDLKTLNKIIEQDLSGEFTTNQ